MDDELRPYPPEDGQDDVRVYNGDAKTPDVLKEDRTVVYGEEFTSAARRGAQQQTEARRAVRNRTGPTRSGHYMPDIRAEEERLAVDKKEHKRRDKIKRRKNRHVFTIMWLLMVILMSLTVSKYLISGSNDFFAVGRIEATVTVEIPENVTVDQLTDILYQKQVINKPEFFKIYCMLTADMEYFREGTFEISTTMDYEGIINYLQSEGERESVQIMFSEGLNVVEIAQKLEDMDVCSAEEFLEAVNNMDFSQYWAVSSVDSFEGTYYKLEGYLFPNTYDFYYGEELDSVIGKMIYSLQENINGADLREEIAASEYSYQEIMTLASIIQAEAHDTEDMYMISAVLHNRLRDGAYRDIYVLGCDSTTYYPYRRVEDLPEGMEDYKSSYDTYTISGLPAGPICNPGIDAIKAALRPSEDGSGYYYFGHHDDGTPYYSRTLSEHEYQRDHG